MIELCLFDLDNTLARTDDLETIRLAGKNEDSSDYDLAVRRAIRQREFRQLYDEELLDRIRTNYPSLRLGIFTRAPRSYAKCVLSEVFPRSQWDVVIGYEDVIRTKPDGEGIRRAMAALGIERPDRILMIGDEDADVCAAYNAGVFVALDKSSWSWTYSYNNWDALNRIPDVVFNNPRDLLSALDTLPDHLPALESQLAGHGRDPRKLRFEKIGKFVPKSLGGGKMPYQVFTCGRSFANYRSVLERQKWHALTASIHEHKCSDSFPDQWISCVRSFMMNRCGPFHPARPLIVTVIPGRPGRIPRLERLLGQISTEINANPFAGSQFITFEPGLLAYRDGVRSNSQEKLSATDRFANVRDHLHVRRPEMLANGARVLVIDDVCTTGASLIYASQYLAAAGAGEVTRLAISMNIGNVLR